MFRIFKMAVLILCVITFFGCNAGKIQSSQTPLRPQTPIMGWSSWNHFHIKIDEQMIRQQADAMVASGMKNAGYQYINIDDGYFGSRDKDGILLSQPEKFPSGMKPLADYIHSKGLKAGIYSDAGADTCASMFGKNKDKFGIGSGLYQHEQQDIVMMLDEWGYDFIKIDWCGGRKLKLDEQQQYTKLSKIIRQVRPDVVFNVCRWEFPGPWVTSIADSWRISGDIKDQFSSITSIIDLNADLWQYAGPGHFNDMDMLQVGRGMTYDEDKTHFSMWCMMASPLLAGNDLRDMSKQTLEILTNKEIIALDQDSLVYQARRLRDDGDHELWARPLNSIDSGQVAVTLLNRSNESAKMKFSIKEVGIDPAKKYTVRDLWMHHNINISPESISSYFSVPAHGVIVLKITGKTLKNNPFQTP